MALCTSCGNQVKESASFCTSCGKPMPTAAKPSSAVTVARPVCSSCGAQADPDSVFCTHCGKQLDAQPAPVDEAIPAVAAAVPVEAETTATVSPDPFCTSCGAKLEPEMRFCTNCGQPMASASTNAAEAEQNIVLPARASEVPKPLRVDPVIPTRASTELTKDAAAPEQVVDTPAPSRVESTPAVTAATPLVNDRTEDQPVIAVPTPVQPVQPTSIKPVPVKPTPVKETLVEPNQVGPVPQIAAPVYATGSDYPPAQPGGGAFRVIVLILLLLILVGGFGGWYFMGVETVIVCSPPDVTVFLDNKELVPTSYGRYVIPHLSRQPHLLRVQRAGFADTIERLDFPMTSLHEWVNIKLVPRRATRPSSSR
jgi:rRNA maturation endonuclease Nob1